MYGHLVRRCEETNVQLNASPFTQLSLILRYIIRRVQVSITIRYVAIQREQSENGKVHNVKITKLFLGFVLAEGHHSEKNWRALHIKHFICKCFNFSYIAQLLG